MAVLNLLPFNMCGTFRQNFCMRQLQFDVVSKRIELQIFGCSQMKEHEILLPTDTKKNEFGSWAGHQLADKHSYYFPV